MVRFENILINYSFQYANIPEKYVISKPWNIKHKSNLTESIYPKKYCYI